MGGLVHGETKIAKDASWQEMQAYLRQAWEPRGSVHYDVQSIFGQNVN